MFIVRRDFGRNTDYLSAWDADYGTACRGSADHAMTFATRESAEVVVERANETCVGFRGAQKPADMRFSVIEVAEPHPNYLEDDEALMVG